MSDSVPSLVFLALFAFGLGVVIGTEVVERRKRAAPRDEHPLVLHVGEACEKIIANRQFVGKEGGRISLGISFTYRDRPFRFDLEDVV